MLSIVEWRALVRLAALEQQRIAARRNGRGVEAQHRSRLEATTGKLVTGHEHAPVQRAKLRFASRSALRVLLYEYESVEHQIPCACHVVTGRHGHRVGNPCGSGAH